MWCVRWWSEKNFSCRKKFKTFLLLFFRSIVDVFINSHWIYSQKQLSSALVMTGIINGAQFNDESRVFYEFYGLQFMSNILLSSSALYGADEVDWTVKEIVETLNLKSMTKSARWLFVLPALPLLAALFFCSKWPSGILINEVITIKTKVTINGATGWEGE